MVFNEESKKQLYIHIGPHKTGTTAVQEYFWKNRKNYVNHGLLYPSTGIVKGRYGPRHLNLSRSYDEEIWQCLEKEIAASNCHKVLVSSERFSSDLSHLLMAKKYLEKYDVYLIIVLRNEVDRVRSRYLQNVKSYFSKPNKKFQGNLYFNDWWLKSRSELPYGRMVQQWSSIYSEENIIYVRYMRSQNFNVINEIADCLSVPYKHMHFKSNKSISPVSAGNALLADRLGWIFGAIAMHLTEIFAIFFPKVRVARVKGFSAEDIISYFNHENAETFTKFPKFQQAYKVHAGSAGLASSSMDVISRSDATG